MKIKMDPHSITMRIKKTSELRRLCIALGGDRLKEKFRKDLARTFSSEQPLKVDHIIPDKTSSSSKAHLS